MIPPEDYLQRTGYRLPTEAEWEFACRSDTSTSYCFGEGENLLHSYAWCSLSLVRAQPVGRLKPNEFALFDMHGNSYECCQERYSAYSPAQGGKVVEDAEDTQAVQDEDGRVLRGGAFYTLPRYVRSAYRVGSQPSTRDADAGFRPARTYP